MATLRFPVMVWRDAAGGYTARWLESDGEFCGFGSSPRQALDDLRTYLHWDYHHSCCRTDPDFLDPELHIYKVEIRPEYRIAKRIYPCQDVITLRVHCVHGRQSSGLLIASLPVIGTSFYFHELEQLPALVQRYVGLQLEGLTPEALASFLPPSEVLLDSVVVRLLNRASQDRNDAAPPELGQVAEALGLSTIRRQYNRPWEREAIVHQLVSKLGEERANILLVGESGVGKTTVLVEAVKQIETKPRPEHDRRPRHLFWQTSAGRIIAGMRYLGQWEERCEEIIGELGAFNGFLCIDRLLELIRTGGRDATDSIAAFLMPYLQRGELRLVAEATRAELDACRRLLPGFAELFQIITVEPFPRDAALRVLDRLLGGLALDHHLTIEPGTTDRIYQLFRRFQPYTVFPGPAIRFTRELIDAKVRANQTVISPRDVVDRFMRQTGLPERFLRDELALHREEIEAEFRQRIIDQPAGVKAATDLVMTFKSGLNDPHRPIGVYLFCGPTGVGKTELALALAQTFFGATEEAIHKRLVRLDMSEYGSFDAVERLIGPPNGEPGELIRRVRQQPFVVVLLDEIEKANPAVYDALMGMFDEGRLTDRYGRVTQFRSAIIIMTSNLGAGQSQAFGFDTNSSGPDYRHAAMSYFRPEFFNRLDGVITFEPLQASTIQTITRKELAAIAQREGLVQRNLQLRYSEEVVIHLAKVGFDRLFGARPLQRTLERTIVAPLAKWLLQRPEMMNTTLHADLVAGEVVFRAAESE